MKYDILHKLLIFTVLLFTLSCNFKGDRNNSDANQSIDSLSLFHDRKNYQINLVEDSSSLISNNENSEDKFLGYRTELDFPTDEENRFINADYYNINISPNGNYTDLKKQIITKRQEYHEQYEICKTQVEKQLIIEQAKIYITETLLNRIIPFWYGMQWNLSGYSEIPNKGEVGCSYFVSNTLKHCGFKVNRYKLAQENTKNIALSVQLNDSILIFSGNPDLKTIKKYFLNNKKEGLYIVGLDCHVGYLLFRKKELFFIQSNYSNPPIVLTEFMEQSNVFASSMYYIADISCNDNLIKKWLSNEEIIVKKG